MTKKITVDINYIKDEKWKSYFLGLGYATFTALIAFWFIPIYGGGYKPSILPFITSDWQMYALLTFGVTILVAFIFFATRD